jgi:hypothetical protein
MSWSMFYSAHVSIRHLLSFDVGDGTLSSATAALLPDGRVIIAGGQNGSSISSTIEIFDPVAGSFSVVGTMSSPRTQHAMAVLHDGRVIITGGLNGTSLVASTDILDPAAGAISAGPSLAVARFGHSATTLLNGQVVVIGGNNGDADLAQMEATPTELFDPTAGSFTTLAANLGTNFVAADNVTATYTRAAGDTVLGGPYHITATLAPAAVLSNYNITNAGASFTINAKTVTPSVTASGSRS